MLRKKYKPCNPLKNYLPSLLFDYIFHQFFSSHIKSFNVGFLVQDIKKTLFTNFIIYAMWGGEGERQNDIFMCYWNDHKSIDFYRAVNCSNSNSSLFSHSLAFPSFGTILKNDIKTSCTVLPLSILNASSMMI